jgi:hypothetical protein
MIVEWPFHMNLFQIFNIFANSFWNRGQRHLKRVLITPPLVDGKLQFRTLLQNTWPWWTGTCNGPFTFLSKEFLELIITGGSVKFGVRNSD